MDASVEPQLQSPARRRLLKFGVAGALVLAVTPLLLRREEPRVATGYRHLREPDLELWRAVIPALLAGTLPGDPTAREPLVAEILLRIDGALALLRPSLRAATVEMLDFVESAPARGLSGGYWGSWRDATIEDATRVLERWSTSRLQLMRACYRSLHDFVMGAWYAMPQSWSAIGYPGPPPLAGASS